MLKRYYSIQEAADFLSSEEKVKISSRDVFEMGARSELRLCAWHDGQLGHFARAVYPLVYPHMVGPGIFMRGYVLIPSSKIVPEGGEVWFNEITIIETISLEESRLPCKRPFVPEQPQGEFWGAIDCSPEHSARFSEFRTDLNQAIIPATDLLVHTKSRLLIGKPISTSERNSLLTIIAALCDYSAIKHQERGAASQIAKLTEEIGAAVSDDTVRRTLAKIPDALEGRLK